MRSLAAGDAERTRALRSLAPLSASGDTAQSISRTNSRTRIGSGALGRLSEPRTMSVPARRHARPAQRISSATRRRSAKARQVARALRPRLSVREVRRGICAPVSRDAVCPAGAWDLLASLGAPVARAQCSSSASSCVSCHEAQALRPVLQSPQAWHADHAFADLCALATLTSADAQKKRELAQSSHVCACEQARVRAPTRNRLCS